MRAWKLTLALTGVLALIQSLPVYYRSSQFDNYLIQETRHVRAKGPLRQALLDKARIYFLPVNEDNIEITSNGAVFRVVVDYSVAINMLVYKPKLKFHSISAGLLSE